MQHFIEILQWLGYTTLYGTPFLLLAYAWKKSRDAIHSRYGEKHRQAYDAASIFYAFVFSCVLAIYGANYLLDTL